MMLRRARLIGTFAILLVTANTSMAAAPMALNQNDVAFRTGGTGSISGALLKDGTVCTTTTDKSLSCDPIAKLPREVAGKISFFDGIFDLDNSGAPEIFLEYWPTTDDPGCPKESKGNADPGAPNCDAIVLLVYKKSGDTYREYVRLNAPTIGYWPGAWFLQESPLRKAVFITRCAGSSGGCLFDLDWKRRALNPLLMPNSL